MEATGNIFANPFSLEELEARFGKAASGILAFFEYSCCIDTIPPLPPGTSR